MARTLQRRLIDDFDWPLFLSVAVIATIPLTANEVWQAMQPGELVCFSDGAVSKVL